MNRSVAVSIVILLLSAEIVHAADDLEATMIVIDDMAEIDGILMNARENDAITRENDVKSAEVSPQEQQSFEQALEAIRRQGRTDEDRDTFTDDSDFSQLSDHDFLFEGRFDEDEQVDFDLEPETPGAL